MSWRTASLRCSFFFFQAKGGIRSLTVTGVQTCALPICGGPGGGPGGTATGQGGAAGGGGAGTGVPGKWLTASALLRGEKAGGGHGLPGTGEGGFRVEEDDVRAMLGLFAQLGKARKDPDSSRMDVPTFQSRLSAMPVRAQYTLQRSEEHTSELQSQSNLVCRLLLEKKKKKNARARECAAPIASH